MSFAAFLNHWWNLPFLVMLGLCGAFFLLQIIGLLGADADHDVDVDHDVHVEAGGGGEDGAGADSDADADAQSDVQSGGAAAGWHEALSFFGVGRVPFMVVWVTLFLFGGFSGIFFNRVLFVRADGAYHAGWFIGVCVAALLIGLIGVRLFSRLAARLVDVGGRGAATKREMTGKIGVVASPVLDARFGEIRVQDDRGNELLLHGCVRDGEKPLVHGAKVVLVSYDGERELYWATACPEVEDQKRS